jgi:uncharacterized Zn-finger protein
METVIPNPVALKNVVNVSVKLQPKELPLACPLPTMTLWNMHPRVYLALDSDNKATCPYCSTQYYVSEPDE